jgi:hypothetical protein
VNNETIALVVLDVILRIVIPIILICGYQRKIGEVGFGPNAIPEHLFEHRNDGWEGGVRLRVCGIYYVG